LLKLKKFKKVVSSRLNTVKGKILYKLWDTHLHITGVKSLKFINYLEYHFIYCLVRKNAAKLFYYKNEVIRKYYERYALFTNWRLLYKNILKEKKKKNI
jgi:hypothetical protein